MASEDKPDIFLEMGTGFFRIPTPQAIYHITILDSVETSATRVVEKIIEVEKKKDVKEVVSSIDQQQADLHGPLDQFYQDISYELYGEIGHLAKRLSATIDETGVKNAAMTEEAAMAIMETIESVQGQTNDVCELLADLKSHKAFTVSEEEESEKAPENPITESISSVKKQFIKAREILTVMQSQGSVQESPPKPAVKIEKRKRYLFDIDVVFQTLYELCTNETVKDHITEARKNAAKIFDTDTFHESISLKAASYEADADNFYSTPMSDIFTSLSKACSEKGTRNLLQKMDSGQASIFLDQTIPLEVPTIEEVEVEIASEENQNDTTPDAPLPPDPRLEEICQLVESGLAGFDEIEEQTDAAPTSCHCSVITLEDQGEIFSKIEAAIGLVDGMRSHVTKIAEALGVQNLSGQQIIKIIKVLSDFQVQLLGIVVSFGSQLKNKKNDASISAEESKKPAQQDVDIYLKKLCGEEDSEAGALPDQETMTQMLEKMDF